MSVTSKLRQRWTDSLVVKQVAEALRHEGDLPQNISPFGFHQGKIDLRGFTMHAPYGMDGTILRGVDLAAASLERLRPEHCRFEEVSFDLADLEGMCEFGNHFTSCTFTGASLYAVILGCEGSQYRDCVFERADFTRSSAIRAEFYGCRFINCKLKGLDFNASSFEDCAFEGLVDDVWFRGGYAAHARVRDERKFRKPKKNRMLNVSFAKAEFRHLTISDGCDLSTVIMPETGEYRKYDRFRERIQRLKCEAEVWSEPFRGAALKLVGLFDPRDESQDWAMFNLSDIEEYSSPAAAEKVLESLDRAL